MIRVIIRGFVRHRNVFRLLLCGFLIHIVILQSAIDVNFSSPIDHGMRPIKSTTNPPAKRVVFIVADGLRAEAIYGEKSDLAPNLRYIRENRGSWGIAQTRVPTESRPGHVALLGGIYEDPSAILKGWKSNPVDFDSVVNQSTNAYCWGGPSILNMFKKDNAAHIHLHSYDSNWEDYGRESTIALDEWVFDQFRDFIKMQYNCASCFEEFSQPGNLIFLHLLGIDTAGHAYKPGSEEYKRNIRFVDSYIPKIEQLIENAFYDSATAYVFASDHGMTNWGSHGAGSDHETKTPLIAWGAGVKIENVQKNVSQIDIAALLSALMGINYPINNLGRLPVDYIDTSMSTLHEMMMSNVQQLMEIYKVKQDRLLKNAVKFVPYYGFNNHHLDVSLQILRNASAKGDHEEFKELVKNFSTFLINGTGYYHNYYRIPILMAITIGILEWILYLSVYNVKLRRHAFLPIRFYDYDYYHNYLFAGLYILICYMLARQHLPWTYYCYFLFPAVMFQVLAFRIRYFIEALRYIGEFGWLGFLGYFIMYVTGIKLLINAFVVRETLGFGMFVMAMFGLISHNLSTHTSPPHKVIWFACCASLAIFPYMPVMKTTFSIVTYLFGYFAWWFIVQGVIFPYMEPDVTNKYIAWQFVIFKLTPLYTLAVETDLIGPESPIKYLAWIWAAVPVCMIPLSSTRIFSRLASIFVGFATYYLMVTANFENLFLICYVSTLYAWIKIESRCFGYTTIVQKYFGSEVRNEVEQNSDDFRRAFFFLVLFFFGFFGTGNIASLNSFDPMWVRCFLTVFSPFRMAGLILLRIAIPFIFVSCAYRAVNLFRRSNTLSMFCIVLMYSDIMLLVFLFFITNVGSWLDIGMSLSHFLIMEGFIAILLMLYGIGYVLTSVAY